MHAYTRARVCRKCDYTEASNTTDSLSSKVPEGSIIVGPSAKSPVCKIQDPTYLDIKRTVDKIATISTQLSQYEELDNCDETKAVNVQNLISQMAHVQNKIMEDVHMR